MIVAAAIRTRDRTVHALAAPQTGKADTHARRRNLGPVKLAAHEKQVLARLANIAEAHEHDRAAQTRATDWLDPRTLSEAARRLERARAIGENVAAACAIARKRERAAQARS